MVRITRGDYSTDTSMECHSCHVMPQDELPRALREFYRKLSEIFAGRTTTLVGRQQMWLKGFNVVASNFTCFSRDESYTLSFHALWRVYAKKAAGNYTYLLLACRNEHIDYVRCFGNPGKEPLALDRSRKKPSRHPDTPACTDGCETLDRRLDCEDALRQLSIRDPEAARALIMVRDGHTKEEIALELGVSVRNIHRMITSCKHFLATILRSYDPDDERFS